MYTRTPRSQTPRGHWHRGVKLTWVINNAESSSTLIVVNPTYPILINIIAQLFHYSVQKDVALQSL